MSLAPFIAAPFLIQVHAAAALAALLLGSYQMLTRKGTASHRKAGWIWVGLMGSVAISSFGIVSARPVVGPFGWIHSLSALTLLSLPLAVLHVRHRRIASHRWAMISLFVGGLVITGAFTLIPGRIMHQVVFGG